ncbi:MAG: DUF2344 domain-containing protein [Lachnospiraceae bacterium]|nr:DUF2344 domain-containing protein [Lachnospiraceae bacterium]
MKVRVKFKKYGPIRFIGHLDVMRFFQKAIRRAELDIAYSAGFSPHQIMSFAAPLGVGLESNGEYMDIELTTVTSSQDMIERLNAVSAPGIEIIGMKELPEGAGNAMASVAAAGYTVRFREGREPGFDVAEKLPEFMSQEQILITKETKKSTLEVDLKPGIYEFKVNEDGSLYLLVDASSAGNIKPGTVIEAMVNLFGENLQENALLITREETYTNLAKPNKKRRLVPLDAIGTDIL